jgi:hypothetical protein
MGFLKSRTSFQQLKPRNDSARIFQHILPLTHMLHIKKRNWCNLCYYFSYQKNAKDLSRRFRDRPQTPLETAIFWTEYVIRHGGAPHLRSAAVDLTWHQYLLLDVTAVVVIIVATVLWVMCIIFKKTNRYLFRKCAQETEVQLRNKKKKFNGLVIRNCNLLNFFTVYCKSDIMSWMN